MSPKSHFDLKNFLPHKKKAKLKLKKIGNIFSMASKYLYGFNI